MKIGIDIDDTTVITVKSMIKYADLYDTQILGGKGTNGNLGLIQNRYYIKVLYGWDEKTKFDFFDTYYKNVLEECEVMLNAPEVIRKLKEEYDFEEVVIGYPKNMDGTKSQKTEKVDELVVGLEKLNITVHKWDERLTTVSAYRTMREMNISQKEKNRVAFIE